MRDFFWILNTLPARAKAYIIDAMYGQIVNAVSDAFALAGRKLGRTTIPRAPLRSALGYAQVAPAGRVFKIGIKNLRIFCL